MPTDYRYVIKFVGDGDGPDTFLHSYDPEAHDGRGEATWTTDPAHARTFASTADALACWRAVPRNRPTRVDGKPNRPLSAFTVEISAQEKPS